MITYLKTTKLANEISTAVKITEKGILNVDLTSITIEEISLDSLPLEIEWHKNVCNYKECTKAEFDNLYIDAVANINELSKL